MILAAGKGTRLLPLTRLRPKCLIPIMNRPLLGLWLEHLALMGVDRVVINTHHLAGQVRAWLEHNAPNGLQVLQSHEERILGTGGGLLAARGLLADQPFLLANADVLAAVDLDGLYEAHLASGCLATLGLKDDPRFNSVALDSDSRVLGFKGDQGLQGPLVWRTYTGLAALSPGFLDYLPAQGYATLVQGIKAAMEAGQEVAGMMLDGFWDDLGQPQRLLDIHARLFRSPPLGLEELAPASPLVLAPGAQCQTGAVLEGWVVMGEGALIESGARVKDSLLLPGARVKAGAAVQNAVLGDGFVAQELLLGGAHA